jgi:hypothetical protein
VFRPHPQFLIPHSYSHPFYPFYLQAIPFHKDFPTNLKANFDKSLVTIQNAGTLDSLYRQFLYAPTQDRCGAQDNTPQITFRQLSGECLFSFYF